MLFGARLKSRPSTRAGSHSEREHCRCRTTRREGTGTQTRGLPSLLNPSGFFQEKDLSFTLDIPSPLVLLLTYSPLLVTMGGGLRQKLGQAGTSGRLQAGSSPASLFSVTCHFRQRSYFTQQAVSLRWPYSCKVPFLSKGIPAFLSAPINAHAHITGKYWYSGQRIPALWKLATPPWGTAQTPA